MIIMRKTNIVQEIKIIAIHCFGFMFLVNPKMLKTIGFGYILFLAKSVLYALIVAGLVWKLKVQ